MQTSTKVGIGAIAVAGQMDDNLVGLGIGSCIVVCLWDPEANVSGMVHVMLPDSAMARGDVSQPGKYADTAVPALVARMATKGASASRLVAKIAGGAKMFHTAGDSPTLAVGERNEEAVRRTCQRMGIPIRGSDCGGTSGRTVTMSAANGSVTVRTLTGGERLI